MAPLKGAQLLNINSLWTFADYLKATANGRQRLSFQRAPWSVFQKQQNIGCFAECRWNPALLASFYKWKLSESKSFKCFFFFPHRFLEVGRHQQRPALHWVTRVVLVLPALACFALASGFEASTVSLAARSQQRRCERRPKNPSRLKLQSQKFKGGGGSQSWRCVNAPVEFQF